VPENSFKTASTVVASVQVVNVTILMSHPSLASTERPEQLGNAGATASTTKKEPEQVTPEQSLPGTLSEKQVPETNQSVPEQTMATTCLTQGGLPDAAARGKSAATSSLAGLHQDDIVEEVQGHP
jgi:hypothetical protein